MRLIDVEEQINTSNKAICKLISESNKRERGFLSQNILDKLRTFVEAIAVKCCGEQHYNYDIFQNKGKPYLASHGNLKFLRKFHKSLQKTVSHYLPKEEDSERLMLKYYEYLLKIKNYLSKKHQLNVLQNIASFPIHIDPLLKEYYEKIAIKINHPSDTRIFSDFNDRYYIKKSKPFFVGHEIFYEVTFTTAIDSVSKFERVIAFTKSDILPNYAVKLSVSNDSINAFGKTMPIQIIDEWSVSIRPCELNKFADIFGNHAQISYGQKESNGLMYLLTRSGLNLVDVIELTDEYYKRFKKRILTGAKSVNFFPILDKARLLVNANKEGANIVKYLLYSMNNKVLKLQLNHEPCEKLSNLFLKWGCVPFDQMPFVTSPLGHNPRIGDLFDCIDPDGREHELLARLIKNNTETQGCLYTHFDELSHFDNAESLIAKYNKKLYYKHKPNRDIDDYKKHYYIHSYELETVSVIKSLIHLSKAGINNYTNSVTTWLQTGTHNIDCEHKTNILLTMFEESQVSLIYGSAGTGKTKLIEHISTFFHDKEKLYLANTNPAVTNLQSRISVENASYQTIARFLADPRVKIDYDILIIDECSTVSNSNMLELLHKASFKLLVLVGDVFQIESIRFGNWFGAARSFVPETSLFELTKPYRTDNEELLNLWGKVRNIDEDITEHITTNNYSTSLDGSIFKCIHKDEIILCLNYDGLYGINNINKFLQGNNKNNAIQWGLHTYKVGDPILFNESLRFKPLIHNNLKGEILDIEVEDEKLYLTVEIDKSINGLDAQGFDLEFLGPSNNDKSIIGLYINKLISTDEDEDSSSAIVPFQIAYAVSIHKAQGLEYDSVKVVITEEAEELITHNIFYTAITRARKHLKIYWTPDTENRILSNLKKKFNEKDVHLLKSKYEL